MIKTSRSNPQKKYKNKSASFGGRTYDSIKEADYAMKLEWQKRAGEISEIIPQFKISIDILDYNRIEPLLRAFGGTTDEFISTMENPLLRLRSHICNYYIDFKIVYADGNIEYHEVKGFETPEWRLKWLLAKAMHQDWTFKLIK